MVKKTIAALVFGLFGVVLAPACDDLGLGTGGCGGTGGDGAVCNIVALSPCDEMCEAEYNDAALTCGSISIEADRKTCQDQAHTAYKECRAACDKDPVEQCRKLCDKENIRCIARCPKGDKGCMNDCNQANGKCLKACEK